MVLQCHGRSRGHIKGNDSRTADQEGTADKKT